MACVHLQQLYQLCQENHLRLSSSDLVHIVCEQCGKQEVCPSGILEATGADEEDASAAASHTPPDSAQPR